MPYLGQRPSKGDENNFKILDDISSYTLSFDGSDSSVVSAANETITSLSHRFVQGQRVTYNNGGGSNIAGLTSGTVYYIIKEDHNTIKLATSASNASNGVAVNITGVGGGSSHTLNVAFDGVNTKFKATHTNGQKAKITRSAQLVISINGVIQQPHDTATPSTGFGFDLDGTIVFSQAPVSTDIFWAHVLTNNNVTFDISDNDIDNFTGDGSTTEFNLTKSPPDNRNVLVTIDGVVQYPNDPDGTVRAYAVVENVLTFNTAPVSGVEIQVRHIGFAGSTSGSGGVTSFYGRTGAVVLKNTDNIVANNAEFAGNLTVQGTMTTLDTKVTEVDQLEVAANNTTVGVAITQSGTGDILNLYDGSTERFSVADGGVTSLKATGDYQGLLINGNVCPTVRFAKNNNTTPEWKAGLSGNNSDNFSISLGGTSNDRLILRSNSATINGTYLNVANLMLDSKVYHSLDDNNFMEFFTDQQYYATNGLERMRIHDSYLVSIGATNISSNTTPARLRIHGSHVNAVGAFGILEFKNRENSGNATASIRANRDGISGSNWSAGLSFHTNSGNPSAGDGNYKRMVITSTGNVGIGTELPSSKLAVMGTISKVRTNGETQVILQEDASANGQIVINNNSNVARTVLSSANNGVSYFAGTGIKLGIGLTNPSGATLVVKNSDDSNLNTINIINDNGNMSASLSQDSTGAGSYLQKDNAGNIKTFIRSYNSSYFLGGNIGIGTDNPSSGKLQVQNGGIAVRGAATPNINFAPGNGSSGNADISFDGDDLKIISNSSGADIRIGAYSKLDHIVVRPNGKIGIGTDNPQTIFHISDNVPTIRFTDENSTGVPDCEMGGAGGNIDISADINDEKSDSVIRFNVDGGEKVRINSSGNVGINTSSVSIAGMSRYLSISARNVTNGGSALELVGARTGSDQSLGVINFVNQTSNVAEIRAKYQGSTTLGSLHFSTSGDEKLQITSSGTVNIGGDYTSTTSRLRINSTSYPETTEYLAVFKAGVANGNRFKNRYIKIRNNYTGSAHGGVPIVWEANADGSNNKAYGAVVTESDGDIRFLNAAATSEKAIGTDLLNTISEKFRINNDGTSLFTGNEVKIYNAINNSNTYFYAQNTGAGNAGIRMKNGSGEWTIIANDSLRFRDEDGSTDRLNITSNGDVGIGTVTPTNSSGYKTLSIKGSTGGQIELSGDSKKHYIWTNNDEMNIAAGYQGGSGYKLKVYTDGGSTSTERVRIEDGIVSILDDTNAYYKPELRIKNTYHGGYGGAITFTGEVGNGTEYTQARIRTYGGNGVGDGTLAIEAGDLNEVARFKSGYMSIGGLAANISGAKGIEISNATTTEIRLKNTNSGTSQADGFGIQKWNNDTVYLYDYDESDMVFGVSNSSKLKLFKQGRLTLSPSGNTNGGNTGYALSIVQDGNYAYNGSPTGTYPGIHIKSTSTGGGNGASIFTPDASWSIYSQSGQTGLAIAPSTTGAASDKVRFFVMQNGQVALGANTFVRIDQAHYNDAQLTVAGGGINIVPITSGTSSPQVRHTVSWYHVGPNSSYSYQHLVTDVWGGGSPHLNTEYIMGGFTIKGYRYSPAGCSNEDIFFHNWGGSMHGYSRHHHGTWDPGNAAYIHSTGYVALRLATGTYYVYDIDLYQFAVYSARDFNVTAVTYSNNTTE